MSSDIARDLNVGDKCQFLDHDDGSIWVKTILRGFRSKHREDNDMTNPVFVNVETGDCRAPPRKTPIRKVRAA